jgi:hypothetical protein
MSKQSLYPYPVYVAQFMDGTMGRLSFWSDAKKTIDFTRGRTATAICYGRPDGAPGMATYAPRAIYHGWVEWNGAKHPDPHFLPSSAAPPRVKPNWKALAQAARQALQAGDHAKALELLQAA